MRGRTWTHTHMHVHTHHFMFPFQGSVDNPGLGDRELGQTGRANSKHSPGLQPPPHCPCPQGMQTCLNPLSTCFINAGLGDFQGTRWASPAWDVGTAQETFFLLLDENRVRARVCCQAGP